MQRLLAAAYVDTSTPLGANGSFQGTSRDCQQSTSAPYDHYGKYRVISISDQPGSLIIQESSDNSTFYGVRREDAVAVTDYDGTVRYIASITHESTSRYVKSAYKNGGTAQGLFRIHSRVIGQ